MINTYKLILVDDEKLALENFESMVDWKKWNIEITGAFLNAHEAIEFIENNKVDAIISDIKMPSMNGVEFAKYIHANFPEIVFVMISGYESFEYAKDALKYNVIEYLLKPVTMSDIEGMLTSVVAQCDKNRKMLSSANTDEEKMKAFIINHIEKRTRDLSHRGNRHKKVRIENRIMEDPVVYAEVKLYNVREFLIKNWLYGREALNNAINNLLNDMDCIAVELNSTMDTIDYILLFDSDEISSCMNKFASFRTKAIKQTKELFNLEIAIMEKKVARNIQYIFDNISVEFLGVNVNIIYNLIKNGKKEDAVAEFEFFKNKVNGDSVSIYKFYEQLRDKLRLDSDLNSDDEKIRELIYCSEIKDVETTEKIVAEIIEYVSSMSTTLKRYDYVNIAKKYIADHYSEPITVSDIAKYVSVSNDYLGRVFKKSTNMTLIDYINEFRVRKSVELLKKSEYPVEEIYAMVGYNSVTNFYKVFKKIMGCTPAKYRDKIRDALM